MDSPLQQKIRQNTSLLRLIQESIATGSAKNLPAGTIEDALDVAIEREQEIYELMGDVDRLNRMGDR